MVTVAPHPLLDAGFVVAVFPANALGAQSPSTLTEGLRLDFAGAPLQSDDTVRGEIRNLLRHGGYKPTGRGKPASEYLLRAVGEGGLNSINPVVDVCNVVSLHSGLPISVVDLDKTRGALRIDIAPEGTKYVFNASGQEIDVGGLVCLFDEDGPCANAVKDSQRTKTGPESTRTLSVLWGAKALGDRTARASEWYRALLQQVGASVEN